MPRIAKALADAGLCSRREAERWIAEGRVAVDGLRIDSPALNVDPVTQRIEVDGKQLPVKSAPRLWLYHKPVGLITSHRDPEGRPTVFENLPKSLPRVVSVGRLDLNSEGLLLLTTDGALAEQLMRPNNGWQRKYRVRVLGQITNAQIAELQKGITVEGMHYGTILVEREAGSGSNRWLRFTLEEGKNREIRRVCTHLGLVVNRLIRTDYGPFTLGTLAQGEVIEVSSQQLHTVLRP